MRLPVWNGTETAEYLAIEWLQASYTPPAFSGGVEHVPKQILQASLLRGVEPVGQRLKRLAHLTTQALGQLRTLSGEEDLDGPAVFGARFARQKTPFLGPVDEPRHRRLLEAKVVGKRRHPEPPIPQDPADPELCQRQVVLGADPDEHSRRYEGSADERLDQTFARHCMLLRSP